LINLRYHIVSLVAVFLALALGMVVGSTVLNEGTALVQRSTSDFLRRQSQQTQAENDTLKGQVQRFQQFGVATLPVMVRGKLQGRSAVLLDTDQVDDGTRSKVEQALRAAGATVAGRLTFASERLALAGDNDRAKLGQLLDVAPSDADLLRTTLIEQLSVRLSVPVRLPGKGENRMRDMITGLSDAKFLADTDLSGPVRDGGEAFPKAGSLFVIIGPTDGSTTLEPAAFLVPLADRLSVHTPAPVAGVESELGVSSWVEVLRGDKEATQRVSTVDDVDTAYGQVALVEALAQRLANRPTGQYGFKQRATGLLPEGSPAS
jgi:Copper transport outer membrane protein, MctB